MQKVSESAWNKLEATGRMGNQRLRVNPEELKTMFDLWVQIAAAFEPGSMNGNGAKA